MTSSRLLTKTLLVSLAVLFASVFACARKQDKESDKASDNADKESAKKSDVVTPLDFNALPANFQEAMAKIRAAQKWSDRPDLFKGGTPSGADIAEGAKLSMDRQTLLASLEMGSKFMVRYQKPEGNFRYQYDWLKSKWKEDDNQVRQTGALWGVSLCHRYRQTQATRAALEKGFSFWFERTVPGPGGSMAVRYEGETETSTGTVALLGLAIIEFLLTEKDISEAFKASLSEKLKGYVDFLLQMQMDDGRFARGFFLEDNKRSDKTSPYFDGEALLCLCKAARYLGYDKAVPAIEKAARAMAEYYTVKAWKEDPDSAETKGFYQWGSMSFVEYYEAKWKEYELMGDTALAMAWWMIYTHDTLNRSLNHSYAVEGLISAYRIAKYKNDAKASADLLYAIDTSLYKLTSWQIGGPLAYKNEFLKSHETADPMATGGVMNKASPATKPKPGTTYHELRVDVTQHQMHAVTMALRYVYPPLDGGGSPAEKAQGL